MTEVHVRVEGAAGATALRGWLRRDPGVSGTGVRIGTGGDEKGTARTHPGTGAGAMGTLESVTAVVDSASGLLALLVAVGAWRFPRGTRPPVVRITEHDGTVLEGAAEDVLAVLRERHAQRRQEPERDPGQEPERDPGQEQGRGQGTV
ncbi:effector-associated constant component EACC1 [Streptomyces sp. WG5]|uniref:effector-associated constant component EACC1 n=1 Tax=Streptomyces sp. WG5 TaxID=3417648 RepID=UPI003CE737DC